MSAALVVRCVQAKRATRRENPATGSAQAKPPVELAFYRKYTEGTLRRFMYRSMEIGKVPSLLGNFSFRGKSSNRRGYTFEDSVIFVYDIERCLKMLDPIEREVVGRIALQEYTLAETASMMRTSVRSTVRLYERTLDRLTHIFLRRELMEVPSAMACQAPGSSERGGKHKQ
jgi:Sigma-70, region 4